MAHTLSRPTTYPDVSEMGYEALTTVLQLTADELAGPFSDGLARRAWIVDRISRDSGFAAFVESVEARIGRLRALMESERLYLEYCETVGIPLG